MKPFQTISDKWNKFGLGAVNQEALPIALDAEALEIFQQLQQRYPRLNADTLLSDLLTAALDDFEQSIPYVRGSKIVAIDEMGDEIYEDSGVTPRFLKLTQKHHRKLSQAN